MLTSPNALLDNGNFKDGILSALKSYLFLKTNVECMTPLFNQLCEQAIELFKPVVEDRKLYKQCRHTLPMGKPVTKWAELYLTDEKTALAMYAWHKTQMAKHGHFVEGKHRCAYGVAENLLIHAENALIQTMEPFTQIALDQLCVTETRNKYLNIIVGLLVSLASNNNIELNIIKETIAKQHT